MKENKAAVATGSRDLDNIVNISDTPYPKLEDDMLIIKTIAHAVNPTDWKHIFLESFISKLVSDVLKSFAFGIKPIQNKLGSIGFYVGDFLGRRLVFYQKGVVVGTDISGIVEEVGKNVKNFRQGDVVASSLHGGLSKNGGFAKYVMVSPNGTLKLSDSLLLVEPLKAGEHPGSGINSFEAAASIPLGLKTIGISFHNNLEIPESKDQNADDFLLIWGGSTATGILAIQIAKLAYGIKVITTASEKHHEKLIELGADKVFDYNDEEVIHKLREAGEGRIKYALDCVSTPETLQSTYDATEGTEKVTIDNLLFLTESSLNVKANRDVKMTVTNSYLPDGRRHLGEKASPEYIKKFLEFCDNILPPVMDKLRTAPLKVLPSTLNSANEGLRLLIENKVSGQKIVFRNGED